MRFASCWVRRSRQTNCWFVALILTVSGCGTPLVEPSAPPPSAHLAAATPQTIGIPAAPIHEEPLLHSSWPGTHEWTERETAVDSLRRIGPSALPALVELLHGSDRNLRELSARAITLMGPAAKAAVPDLEAALSDLDPDVRKNVMRALGQMGPAAESAIPALVQEIHRSEPVAEPSKTLLPKPAQP